MYETRSTEIKVGIVTLAGVILLIAGILLGKGFSVSSKEVIKLRFENSGGITVASPVVVNGVERGRVSTVENNNGSVLVTAQIDNTKDFKQDVNARITILEITGGKKIEISPGKSPNQFNISNEIPGTTPPDIPELVAVIGTVSGDAVSLIRRLDTVSQSLTLLLADGKVIDDLKSTASNASQMTSDLSRFMTDNYHPLEQSISNLKSLTGQLKEALDKNTPQAERILQELELTLIQTKSFINRADTTVLSANELFGKINKSFDSINNNNSILNRLIYDEALSATLDSTLFEVNTFIKQVKEHGVNINARLGSRP